MTLRTVGARLTLEISQYMANLNRARAGTKDFFAELDKAARAGRLDAVADQAGRMGLALSAGFVVAVSAAAKFEKQMSAVDAVTNATATDLDRLRQAALQAGKDTAFSATEAAKAESELAKAGLSTSEILSGALSGSLSLAAAGQLDLAEAADVAAKTMNVFKLQGKDVGHIADVLAAAANKSATDVHEMGEALRMGGLAASAAGMSLEETVGTLAAFADRALVGSDAGTSLKTALIMLQNPTDKAMANMEALGISAYDAGGNFIGTAKLAGQLQAALGGLTQQERNAALATIFGADAMRAANVLYELGEEGVRDYVDAVDDQGAAARTAAKLTDNLMGDIERLTGSLETLAIESGGGANEGLRVLVQSAGALVDQVSLLPSWLQSSTVVLAGLAGASLLAMAGFVRTRGAVRDTVTELNAMGPAGHRAGKGLEFASKWGGRAAAAFIALEVAGAVVSNFGTKVNPQVDALADGLAEFGKNGTLAGETARVLGNDMGNLVNIFQTIDSGFWTDLGNGIAGTIEGITGTGEIFNDSLLKTRERIAGVDQALTQLVQSGRSEDAAAAFNRLAREGEKHGVSIRELRLALPSYAAAADQAAKATDGQAIAAAKAANRADLLAGGLEGAAEAGKELSTVFDDLNGTTLSWVGAENKMQKAVDDAADAVRKNGRTLKSSTDEGRANRDALVEIAEATRDAMQARYDDTQSLEQANKVYEEGRAAFVKTARAAGLTREAAEALADSWMEMPDLKITTPGADAAISKLGYIIKLIKGIDGASIRIYADNGAFGTHHDRRWGGITEHARMGTLRDAGIYSGGPLYAFAEPETRGEAFVPRDGDYSKSMGILSHAAGWYGASVVPGRAQSGMASTQVVIHEHHHTVTLRGDGVLSGLRDEIRFKGGNTQSVTGARR